MKFFYSNEAISFPLLSGDPNIGVKMRMRVAKSSYHTKAGSSEHLHLRTATNCQLSFIAPLKYLKWYWARLWGPGTSNFLCIYHFYFLPSPTYHYRLRFKLRTAQPPCLPCNIHTFCLVLIKLCHCSIGEGNFTSFRLSHSIDDFCSFFFKVSIIKISLMKMLTFHKS